MKTNTLILYRVIQEWRAPVFEKLSNNDQIDLEVWHGPDFKGTKVVSTMKHYTFKKRKLFSFKLKLNSRNGLIAMPLTPLLIFSLIRKNPDVVICEGASNLANAMMAFTYCKLFRKKFIWWSLGKLQNRVYDKKRLALNNYIEYIERKSDAIITYSSVGERYFLDLGIDKAKIFKAVNVVDTHSVIQLIEQKNDFYELRSQYNEKFDFITLFVGALIKEKSIELLLHAQKQLEDKYPRLGLIIVGDGNYRRELELLSQNLNIINIEFVGKKIDDNYKYFSIADVFVLPGLGGLAISEAMCYGLPIIASIGDGCEVDLVGPNNGIINQNVSSQSLANDIESFFLNEERKREFGNESRRIIKEQYNIQNYLDQIIYAIKS